MLIEERSNSYQDYRFGFNGYLNDLEVVIGCGILDFGARIYDSRVGRFLSTDPKTFPYWTPFQYDANCPTSIKDHFGMGPDDIGDIERIESQPIVHTLKEGDNPWSLAKKYHNKYGTEMTFETYWNKMQEVNSGSNWQEGDKVVVGSVHIPKNIELSSVSSGKKSDIENEAHLFVRLATVAGPHNKEGMRVFGFGELTDIGISYDLASIEVQANKSGAIVTWTFSGVQNDQTAEANVLIHHGAFGISISKEIDFSTFELNQLVDLSGAEVNGNMGPLKYRYNPETGSSAFDYSLLDFKKTVLNLSQSKNIGAISFEVQIDVVNAHKLKATHGLSSAQGGGGLESSNQQLKAQTASRLNRTGRQYHYLFE